MRKLVYFVACTIDGFIADERGALDFFPTQGAHLPYIVAEYPETIPGHLREALGVRGNDRHFDTVLMGRHTYEVGTAIGVTSPYPHLRQYVVSETMPMSPSADVRLVSSHPLALVRELKHGSGLDIWLCGGGRLAAALLDELDELIVKINPIVLGRGTPLFGHAGPPLRMSLLDQRTFAGGVAIHRYGVAA